MSIMWHISLCLLVVLGYGKADFTTHRVETMYGTVIGQSMKVHGVTTGIRNISSFWAIPFAAPPVGDLRFAKPRRPANYSQPFVADTPGKQCPQSGAIFEMTHIGWNNFGEDCLHLNVFTPSEASYEQKVLPVMVFFHGGGYGSSGNIQYPGYTLAMRDVVVVVPNHRLGILGYFSADHNDYRGNWGLWDQRQALLWVQDNIAAFGGDPNQVTIFGQSSGATSTGLHLISPQTQHLYHQAICESGNELSLWAINEPEQHPELYGEEVARSFDCHILDQDNKTDIDAMVHCLRQVDSSDVVSISPTCSPGYYCLGFEPVIDGEFIPDYPIKLRREGKHHKGPLLQGHNKDDGSLYSLQLIAEAGEGGFTHEQQRWHMYCNLIKIFEATVESQEAVENIFQAFSWYYAPWPHIEDKELNRAKMNELVTDAGFGIGGDQQVKFQQQVQKKTWQYLFGYRSSIAWIILPEWLGVPHMAELPYVWGYPFLRIKENAHLRHDCLIKFDIVLWNEQDIAYVDFISALWTNFAKTGDPNVPTSPPMPFDQAYVKWLPFDTKDYNYYSMGQEEIRNKAEYRQQQLAFYTSFLKEAGLDFLGPPTDGKKGTKNNFSGTAKGDKASLILPDCETYPADP